MTVLGDLWGFLPKEVKFLFMLSVFLVAGSTLLQGIVIVWNIFGVNGINLINGCGENPELCVPQQEGLYIFGINFADYWTILVLILFPTVILGALKWYSMTLDIKGNG